MFIWEACLTQTSADYDDGAAFTFKHSSLSAGDLKDLTTKDKS